MMDSSFPSGATISPWVLLSPMTASLGWFALTKPPSASFGTSSLSSFLMLTPGIALMTLIARLMAEMKPFMMPIAPLRTALMAPFTAPLMASPTAVPMEVNRPTMVSHTPWKNSPTPANTALMASHA